MEGVYHMGSIIKSVYLTKRIFFSYIMKDVFISFIILFLLTISSLNIRADEEKTMTLNDCIRVTLENNPQLKASEMDVLTGEGNYGIARSNLLPQINFVANAQRTTSNLIITSKSPYASLYYKQPDNTNYPYYTASVTLTQQLFSFGKNYFGMKSSEELINAARYNLRNTRNTLIYNVKQNFYNLLQYNMIIESDKYLLKQMETQLQQAESYYKAGLKTKIDVLSAKTSLGNIKLSLITAENARKIYILNLLSLMGLPLTSAISFTGTLEATPITFDTSLYVSKALENRPDYLSLKKQLDSAQYSYKQSISSYFPTLSGNASYNWAGQDFPLVWNWAIGLELDFNIFSGFATTSAMQVARAQLLKIKYSIDQEKLAVELSVQSALDNIDQAQKSIAVAKDTLSEAEANLQLTEKGYIAGLNNYLDYLTAVANYQNAEASYATALASYNIAVANLEYVTGDQAK
jgi:outer membrane protein TolC